MNDKTIYRAAAPVTVASALAANQPISYEQAVSALRASRAAGANRPDPISEAARALGQHAAKARQERQAQAAASQHGPIAGQEPHVEDDPAADAGETQDEIDTANGEQPNATDDGDQDEPAEGRTIDLGDGVKVSLDEVRDGFMMKADHTRKTQALADERNHFQADRAQRADLFDKMLGAAKQMLPQFKDVVSLMDELGEGPGMREFARQQAIIQHIGTLEHTRRQEQAYHDRKLRDATIKVLAETHGDKAPAHYNAAVRQAAEWTGMPVEYLAVQMAHPAIADVVHDAKKWRDLQASKGNVQRQVAGKPRVVKPGARVSQQAAGQASIHNAHAKLKSSGNLADAVALLRTLRGGKGRAG